MRTYMYINTQAHAHINTCTRIYKYAHNVHTHTLRHIRTPLPGNPGKTFIKCMLRAGANCDSPARGIRGFGWDILLGRWVEGPGRKGTARGTKVLPGTWVAARRVGGSGVSGKPCAWSPVSCCPLYPMCHSSGCKRGGQSLPVPMAPCLSW